MKGIMDWYRSHNLSFNKKDSCYKVRPSVSMEGIFVLTSFFFSKVEGPVRKKLY